MTSDNSIKGVFKTGNQPKTFVADFDVLQPCVVEVTLSDPTKPNTAYTVRAEEFKRPSSQSWIIKLPRTSEVMLFSIKINSQAPIDTVIKMKQLSIRDYVVATPHFNPKIASFYRLVHEFSDKAGYLPTGKTYVSDDGQFEIEYLDFIPDGNGGIHPTPARIHNTENYIQVSAHHMIEKPIARREGILSHELAHNFVNSDPDSEDQADMNGAMLFDQLGWNDWDYIYSFTKTFEKATRDLDQNIPSVAYNNAVNHRRARNIIKRYQRKNILRA